MKGPIPIQWNAEAATTVERLVRSVARLNMRCLEVGSWLGGSALCIGNIVKENDGLLYCVDWWKGCLSVPQFIELSKEYNLLDLFIENMKDAGLEDHVLPMKMKSDQAAFILGDGAFDLVFIDGEHLYEYVKKDILMYLPKVRKGGILCGHDCVERYENLGSEFIESNLEKQHVFYPNDDNPTFGVHPGVVKAVHEVLGNCDYQIENEIWWLTL